MKKGNTIQKRMIEEEKVREKTDEKGRRWIKVYFGGGAHFKNWLDQFIELKGRENIATEEIEPAGFKCYEDSGEKMYRIWVKES